ncbi:MAG: cell wall metabolism sensor histidine kinase WalK [Candidatus Eremiobacteraeota bacterium]|nr:cell wall metabolism sensor histidine kinase WalK [Candidatus Eremiobacteraeota bacterium]
MSKADSKTVYDEFTNLPILSSVYKKIDTQLKKRDEVGFLYFDISNFRWLEEKYGHGKCRELLKLVGNTLEKQKGKLYRDEDLVVVGGKGLAYFILFLFSPPRRKEKFANHDLKLISTRIKQKLKHIIDEHNDVFMIDEEVDFHTGYTVIKEDPFMEVERLIYEAGREAGFKAQLEEIMVQFIANVSHELRTPLTSIKGYAETLLDGAMTDAGLCHRWLQIIYDESQRLERLINDLLDLSMLEAEQVELHYKSVDIRKVIDHVIFILHPLAAKENIGIETDYQKDLPLVFVDEDRMKQVLLNLIHNAVKYSPEGSSITIEVSQMERETQVSITDRGTGIPQSHLNRIFERFYRVEKDKTGKTGGRGLGLSIARHIVEIHGGTIGATSKPGNGTTFRFTIPPEPIFPIDI